ncbi:MAG: hypothetical protein K2X64_07580 [Rhodocyclaceae bacterium]|nr:hypothetical protein [Rhodocyclaceae bacterium]
MNDQLPQWASKITSIYWELRMLRPGNEAKRRQLYRKLAKEKAWILESGVPAIELHLVSRVLCSKRGATENAKIRLKAYRSQLTFWPLDAF